MIVAYVNVPLVWRGLYQIKGLQSLAMELFFPALGLKSQCVKWNKMVYIWVEVGRDQIYAPPQSWSVLSQEGWKVLALYHVVGPQAYRQPLVVCW